MDLIYEIVRDEIIIGYIQLYNKDEENRHIKMNGDFFIENGLEYLKKAAVKILKIAFEELKMEKVIIETVELDEMRDELAVYLRFNFDGILREHLIIDNIRHTLVVKSLLKHEYERFYYSERGGAYESEDLELRKVTKEHLDKKEE